MTKRLLFMQKDMTFLKVMTPFYDSFLNIFVNYPSGQMRATDMKWNNWNNAPFKLWQTQLNFAVFCALNYKKHSVIRLLY